VFNKERTKYFLIARAILIYNIICFVYRQVVVIPKMLYFKANFTKEFQNLERKNISDEIFNFFSIKTIF
jgi:hypothetical protein